MGLAWGSQIPSEDGDASLSKMSTKISARAVPTRNTTRPKWTQKGEPQMRLAEQLIGVVNWSSYQLANTDAGELGSLLHRVLESHDGDEAVQLWKDHIENQVFIQNSIFSSAEPTIDVLIASLLDERPEHVRGQVIELMFFLLNAESLEDPDLARRCHERARMGLWVILKETRFPHNENVQDLLLYILKILDPDRKVQALTWLDLKWS
jgi:hypothetical protein